MFETFFSPDWIRPLFEKLKNLQDNRSLELHAISDIFGDPAILAKYYIEPYCQHHNPADYNEVEAISCVQSPVFNTINRFLNRELLIRDGRSQLFVLSDAGMGKTSLLMMLKLAHITSFWPKTTNCILFKIDHELIEKVKNIDNKAKTILLLDALDEDSLSYGNLEYRLSEILEETKMFRRVIITCRTQFFPRRGVDPFDRPGRIQIGGFVCPQIFLSYFDDEQVDLYLRKKFKDNNNIELAKDYLDKMESLRLRPFLLAHIEDILESDKSSWSELSIFEALVAAWLLREEVKINRIYGEKKITSDALFIACMNLAYSMHTLEHDAVSFDMLDILIEKDKPNINNLNYFDVGGRSLLNRKSDGKFRFAHYSVQEYLLAKCVIDGLIIGKEIKIRVTDQILNFFKNNLTSKSRLCLLDFKNFKMSGYSFCQDNFANCKDMKFAEFYNSNFNNISFKFCDLGKIKFVECDLSMTDFSYCNLKGAEFFHCDLTGAKFYKANLFQTNLINTKGLNEEMFAGANTGECAFPKGFVINKEKTV